MHHASGRHAPFHRNGCTIRAEPVHHLLRSYCTLGAVYAVENAIRPFVVGRKGWLFADTPQGAEASAIIYSLMETAKANSLRLDDYLLHLLSVFPERVAQRKDFEMDDLLPWSGEMKSWFSAV